MGSPGKWLWYKDLCACVLLGGLSVTIAVREWGKQDWTKEVKLQYSCKRGLSWIPGKLRLRWTFRDVLNSARGQDLCTTYRTVIGCMLPLGRGCNLEWVSSLWPTVIHGEGLLAAERNDCSVLKRDLGSISQRPHKSISWATWIHLLLTNSPHLGTTTKDCLLLRILVGLFSWGKSQEES